eukprot:TRINITY_DN10584_c0_g3_i2.p1 TRINITY_DN10584_c0_g3~~TRINITY_DN10584_c0_g3_i2.p1  ORF type:complete len:221 (+),score=12.23 TRINITY_DN10584_c0_g3_i2:75-665(+)
MEDTYPLPAALLKRLPKEHLLKPLSDLGTIMHCFAAKQFPDPNVIPFLCKFINVEDVGITNQRGYTFPWTYVCYNIPNTLDEGDEDSYVQSTYSYTCDNFLQYNQGADLHLQDMNNYLITPFDFAVVWKVLYMTTRALVRYLAEQEDGKWFLAVIPVLWRYTPSVIRVINYRLSKWKTYSSITDRLLMTYYNSDYS